jgi:hypothetical protein
MQSASAKCFLFTAAVFLLQVFPLTGMLLMILAVPFWSVITINLGFILVIADVVAGTLPRGALALPVIYFGGYFLTAGASHFEARSLANSILADNAGNSLPFAPGRDSLFFEARGPALNAGSDFSLDTLIESYAINSAYRRWETSKSCPIYGAVELRSSGCAQGSGVVATDSNGCVTTTQAIWASSGSRLLKGICRAYTPVKSLDPSVTLQRTAILSRNTTLYEAGIETFELKRSTGASIQIKAGYVYPLAWFPIPIMGCMPRDWVGGARGTFRVGNSWTCAVYFARDFVIPLGAIHEGKRRGATDAIAGALKLPPSSVTARFPERSS